ncbi:hypothetical protein ACFPTO_06610 [Paraburkholderia denitrificans]|uniref:Helix-turn-helix domain-containing protein n=1 Tax=Paraburkholderia denitrificans TaxID=694025 RepID=A0ABW0J612_9BURK
MKNKNAQPGEAESSAKEHREFTEIKNPRQLRVLHALVLGPRPREELDRIAGCPNSPTQVAALRRKGFLIPCALVPMHDRDGLLVKRGVYYFALSDRRTLNRLLKAKEA